MAEEKGGLQLESRALLSFENAIDDVNGVLQMQHQNAFFENEIAHVIGPDRQSIFEAEFMQIIGGAEIKLATGAFFRAERNDVVITETQKFGDMTPHHHATVWRRPRGDDQTMITPGDRTWDSSGSEPAESIGHEPLALEEQFSRMARFVPWQGAGGESHLLRNLRSVRNHLTKI